MTTRVGIPKSTLRQRERSRAYYARNREAVLAKLRQRRRRQRETVDKRIAEDKQIDEVIGRALSASAKVYDEFMERFGIPTTPEEAEVIEAVQRLRETGD